jgi:hypothetical protein
LPAQYGVGRIMRRGDYNLYKTGRFRIQIFWSSRSGASYAIFDGRKCLYSGEARNTLDQEVLWIQGYTP